MSLLVFFVLSFFPRDVFDEIWDLIESVSEGFPTYSCSITVLSHEKLSRGKWYSVRKAIRQFSILPPISYLNKKSIEVAILCDKASSFFFEKTSFGGVSLSREANME